MGVDSGRPKVSVIIPAYNAGAFIRAAVESVLSQTYQDIEVLVIDDGSTDETAAVIQSFGSRLRYISQSNSGPSAARNRGILDSSGEILAFLDADDMWTPSFLELQLAALSARPDVGAVYAWAQFVDEHGQPLADSFCPGLDGVTLRRLLLGGDSILLSAVAIRRESFQKVGVFDPALRQAEDWDLFLRMLAAGIRFDCIPRLLVHRRVHPGSLTTDIKQALHWEQLALQKALSTLPLPPDCRTVGPAAGFRILLRAAIGYWRQGDRKAAVERLREGFAAWPAALHRPQTYLGVIFRLPPSGRRSEKEILRDLERLADETTQLLHEVFRHGDLAPAVRANQRVAWSALHAVFALLFMKKRHWKAAMSHAVRSMSMHPIPPLKGAATAAYRAATRHARSTSSPMVAEE